MHIHTRRMLAAGTILAAATCLLVVGVTPVSALTTTYTANFGAQSPNPAPASSTITWTVTFTRAAASNVNIGVDLLGTGGEGTLSAFTTNSGGACATSTPGPRGFRCDWQPGDPNTAVVAFTVNLGAGAAPPDWSLDAVVDEAGVGTLVTTQSVVIQPLPTTTTSTATTTPTTGAATTTVPAVTTAPATSTAVGGDSGGLPATGSSGTMVALAGALLAAGALLLVVRRRSAEVH